MKSDQGDPRQGLEKVGVTPSVSPALVGLLTVECSSLGCYPCRPQFNSRLDSSRGVPLPRAAHESTGTIPEVVTAWQKPDEKPFPLTANKTQGIRTSGSKKKS